MPKGAIMTKFKYNTDILNNLDIREIIVALGGKLNAVGNCHCPNHRFHKNGDSKPSMTINANNSAYCHTCGIKGKPVELTKLIFKGDYKGACEFLHSRFNIPFLTEADQALAQYKCAEWAAVKAEREQIKFVELDFTRSTQEILVKPLLKNKAMLDKEELAKLVYTAIYRFSISEARNRKWLNAFYYRKKLSSASIQKIGVIDSEISLEKFLDIHFSEEELVSVGAYYEVSQRTSMRPDGKLRRWKFGWNKAVIPFTEFYSDLCGGLELRDLGGKLANKTSKLTSSSFVGLPFGASLESLKSAKRVILCEGHTDALSYPVLGGDLAVSFSGVYSYKKESLGAFAGKEIVIAFDKDDAGVKGAKELKELLSQLGVKPKKATWSSGFKDINELLVNNLIHTIQVVDFDEE